MDDDNSERDEGNLNNASFDFDDEFEKLEIYLNKHENSIKTLRSLIPFLNDTNPNRKKIEKEVAFYDEAKKIYDLMKEVKKTNKMIIDTLWPLLLIDLSEVPFFDIFLGSLFLR